MNLEQALELILDDLTENNAHTIAALLESFYSGNLDPKFERAYKAAQFEIWGTK